MAGVVIPLRKAFSSASRSLLLTSRLHSQIRYVSTEKNEPAKNTTAEGIEISNSCVVRLRELGDSTLRVGVEGGGCSGFQYTFELDSPVEEGDRIIKKDGVTILVDENSMEYLQGATIEYHTELIRSAFRVVKNPMAEQGCSCGASFNLKLPK